MIFLPQLSKSWCYRINIAVLLCWPSPTGHETLQNKRNGILRGSLSHNALLELSFLSFALKVFCVYIDYWFCVFMEFLCVSASFVFLVLFVWLLFFCLFCPVPVYFYFILFYYYYFKDVCLFSNEREILVDLGGRGVGEDLGGIWGGEPLSEYIV